MSKEFYENIFPVNPHWNIAHTLVGHGIDLNGVDAEGRTLLFRAVLCNNDNLVKFLLTKSSTDINQVDIHGVTPLKLALQNNFVRIAELLVQHGAAIYDDILIDCANLHNQKFTQSLLLNNANINKVDEEGRTIIFHAILCDNYHFVKFLLTSSSQPDVNHADIHGITPLKLALQKDHIKIAELLVQHGAALYDDILIDCIHLDNAKFISYLLSKNANTNAQDNNGMTPLMHYILTSWTYAHLLLDCKVDVTTVDNNNRNALWYAVQKDNYCVSETLVQRCIDVNVADTDGVTPFMIAAQHGKTDIVNLLLKHGADINVKDTNGKDALMYVLDDIYVLKSKGPKVVGKLDENAQNLINFIKNM